MVHLISDDLNRHERPSAYAAVARVIEQHATDYRRPLYSQWLVETSESTETWSGRLRTVTDPDDGILVVRVEDYAGYLDRQVWPWLGRACDTSGNSKAALTHAGFAPATAARRPGARPTGASSLHRAEARKEATRDRLGLLHPEHLRGSGEDRLGEGSKPAPCGAPVRQPCPT
jgi:hypothetical protein